MTSKDDVRREHLRRRAEMTATARADAADRLAAIVADAWPAPRRVAAYVSLDSEPGTGPLLGSLLAAGTEVVVPVVAGDALDWAAYIGADSIAVTGSLGVAEPHGRRLGHGALTGCDLVLVPALAADRYGRRLGRGRGFYDRALAGIGAGECSDTPRPLLVAVVFDDELIDAVPTEPHDVRVDAVLTPGRGVLRCRPL